MPVLEEVSKKYKANEKKKCLLSHFQNKANSSTCCRQHLRLNMMRRIICTINSQQRFHFWKCAKQSRHGRFEMSSSGFELARKSFEFRVFPAGLCPPFSNTTTNEARFFVWCTCEFVCLLFRPSLWNISYQRFFQVSKKSARHSRDILVVSWNVEMGRASDGLWQNDRLLRGILFTDLLYIFS